MTWSSEQGDEYYKSEEFAYWQEESLKRLGIKANEFNIILADPPWQYGNWSTTARGSAKAHYWTMPYKNIAQLRDFLELVMFQHSYCVMWGTWPKMDQAIDILRGKSCVGEPTLGWDYSFVTGFPWIKVTPSAGTIRRGVGFWSQSASEYVLIGARKQRGFRGASPEKLKKNVVGLLCGSDRQFYDRISIHSRKPYGIHEYLEEKFPDAKKLELFATEPRKGWTCIGHKLGWHVHRNQLLTLEEAKKAGHIPEDYDPNKEHKRKLPPRKKPKADPESAVKTEKETPIEVTTEAPVTEDKTAISVGQASSDAISDFLATDF